MAYPIATDDRCANFSASTCPTQPLNLQQALQRTSYHSKNFIGCLTYFWGNFLKLHTISSFVFFLFIYRVVLDPVFQNEACGAPLTRPGGGAKLSCSPGPRFHQSLSSVSSVSSVSRLL